MKSLITKFTWEYCKDEPDWSKLTITNAWGSPSAPGVYSEIADKIEHQVLNHNQAKEKYGYDNAFLGSCRELLANDIPELFDAVLIDEAQDLPQTFFEMIYHATRAPKRIIYAYDELQSLNSIETSPPDKLFGYKRNGKPRVELRTEEKKPRPDIVLPVCYRNPPWLLSTAHALGFGIHRKEGIVQMFKETQSWGKVGYNSVDGEIVFGEEVSFNRTNESTPEFFKELIDVESSMIFETFQNSHEELDWVLQQIENNLTTDELEHDDILIIVADHFQAERRFQEISKVLKGRGIKVHSPGFSYEGITYDRSKLFIQNSVAVTHIHRAKGNEAPVVYLVGAQYCASELGEEAYRRRNSLFTALTRARGWVRVTGIGSEMQDLKTEFTKVKKDNYYLKFKYPTKEELNNIRTLNDDSASNRSKENSYLQKLSSEEITGDDIPDKYKRNLIKRINPKRY